MRNDLPVNGFREAKDILMSTLSFIRQMFLHISSIFVITPDCSLPVLRLISASTRKPAQEYGTCPGEEKTFTTG